MMGEHMKRSEKFHTVVHDCFFSTGDMRTDEIDEILFD